MSKALIKPRWEAWEHQCVKKASEEQIQLKIIAAALGRSITAVSKMIKNLKLRPQVLRRGRAKGTLRSFSLREKTLQDARRMRTILHSYAPLKIVQKAEMTFQKAHWLRSQPPTYKDQKGGEEIGKIVQENAIYTLGYPHKYLISEKDAPVKSREKKLLKDPYYVPLNYVEKWAAKEGFHQVEEELQKFGFSYWKDGKYFSKAQLQIYINQIRLEKKLTPLIFYEEEIHLQSNSST